MSAGLRQISDLEPLAVAFSSCEKKQHCSRTPHDRATHCVEIGAVVVDQHISDSETDSGERYDCENGADGATHIGMA